MSKQTRVLRWLDKHPEVKRQVIQSACQHKFETLKTKRQYKHHDYSLFFYGSQTFDVQIKVCNKCGKQVE